MTGWMAVGSAVALLGVVITFVGVAVRGRLVGLATMGLGSVMMLSAGGPTRLEAVWTALLAASTLAGMLAFGVVLARRLDATDQRPDRRRGPVTIDEDRR
jgi:hypothetical protein